MGFLPSIKGATSSHHYFKEPEMENQKITYEQARSLVNDGFMTEDNLHQMVENGTIKIFSFRKTKDKPEAINRINDELVSVIQRNALILVELGYRPSITWKDLTKNNTISETSEMGTATHPFPPQL